jgi:hypothetical protein
MRSSGQSTPASSAHPTPDLANPALRAEILAILGGGSMGNLERLPPAALSPPPTALSLNAITQLTGNSGATNGPQTTAQLMVRSVPSPGTMPSTSHQLALLIQEKRAQQALLAAGSMNASCRNPSSLLAEHQQSQLPYLAHLRSGGARESDRVSQVSYTNSSSSSESALAEIFRLINSSGQSTPATSAPPTPAFLNPALRAEILASLGGSMRNLERLPPAALSLNAITQLTGNRGATNGLQANSRLSPEEELVALMMQSGQVASPDTMTSTRHQMAVLMQEKRARQAVMAAGSMSASYRNHPSNHFAQHQQEKRAQQALMAAASMNASSRNHPSSRFGEHQHSQLPYLEHIQLLAQLQSDTLPLARPGLQPVGLPFGGLAPGPTALPPNSVLSTAITMPIPAWKAESFPGKLYRMLVEVESQGNTEIISFTPDGKAFRIHDPDAFLEQVSPKYFNLSRFNSFVRQLNFYGFERLSLGPDRGAFAHASFIRGRPELLGHIQRRSLEPSAKKG